MEAIFMKDWKNEFVTGRVAGSKIFGKATETVENTLWQNRCVTFSMVK